MLKRQNSVADSSFCAADADAIRCCSFLLNKNHTDIAHKVKKIYIYVCCCRFWTGLKSWWPAPQENTLFANIGFFDVAFFKFMA